jgi:phage terminase small subunit
MCAADLGAVHGSGDVGGLHAPRRLDEPAAAGLRALPERPGRRDREVALMPNPPVPTVLKEARGTARRDRGNPAEPAPAILMVGSRPPSWLKGPRRVRAWEDLSELLRGQRLLTVLDTAALALLVDAYGDYLEASDLVTGRACGHCGLPLTSKDACSLPGEWLEGEDGERTYLPAAHDPGRRYYTTTTKEGSFMVRPHPAMAVRQDAWKRVIAILREFGMTPSARTRVAATEGGEKDPLDEFLGQGAA